jgi:hypothetical protein
VPEESDGLLSNLLDRPEGIVIAVGTGKDDDAEFHLSLSWEWIQGQSNMASFVTYNEKPFPNQ